MSIQKKTAAVALSFAIALGGVVVLATPASAAEPSCVHVTIAHTVDGFGETWKGKAINTCTYNITGKWKLEYYNNPPAPGTIEYGPCTMVQAQFGQTLKNGSVGPIGGTAVLAFVSC